MIHRCEHLTPDQAGEVRELPYNVLARVCAECKSEFDLRLGEMGLPPSLDLFGQLPASAAPASDVALLDVEQGVGEAEEDLAGAVATELGAEHAEDRGIVDGERGLGLAGVRKLLHLSPVDLALIAAAFVLAWMAYLGGVEHEA